MGKLTMHNAQWKMGRGLPSVFLLILVLMVSGCGGPKVTPEMPPEIRYGEDVCVQCGMIISDERYAAGLVVETAPSTYAHRIFDDIGGMFVYAAEHRDNETIVSYFVHDYTSLAWIDAQTASFVSSQPVLTPMGFGLSAFEDSAAAQAMAEVWGGQILSFDDVQKAGISMPSMN